MFEVLKGFISVSVEVLQDLDGVEVGLRDVKIGLCRVGSLAFLYLCCSGFR